MSGSFAKTGISVVGLGQWGPNHARVIRESGTAELRFVCDRDTKKAEKVGDWTGARTTSDFEVILDDDATDAVIVATPISSHFELARRCLEAGKHVLVEKPIASSEAEADELFALAGRCGRAIMCGHTFIFSPAVVKIRELIRQGELGEIFFVTSSRVNLGRHQADASVVWDLAPHEFSILLNWFEELPDSITTIGRDSIVPGRPDVAFTALSYASGLVANVELSWLAPSKLRRTVLVGSKKMVVYDDTATEQVRIFDHGVDYAEPESFGEFQLSYRTGDILSPKLPTQEPLVVQLDAFIEAIKRGGAKDSHMTLARNVVSLIEAAEESLESGGTRVTLRATGQLLTDRHADGSNDALDLVGP